MTDTDDRAVHRRPGRRTEISPAVMRGTREQLGLTRAELARRITASGVSVTRAWLGQIEAGRGHPSPEFAPVLAEALGLTLDELTAP